MNSVTIFSGSNVDGSTLHPGEPLFCLAMFGGVEVDLTNAPPDIEVTVVAIFGGAKVKVRRDEEVLMSGFSLFGGRKLDPRRSVPSEEQTTSRGRDALPLDILAYCFCGGVHVCREGQGLLRRVFDS